MPPPLISAIKDGNIEEVKRLVQNGADLEATGDKRYQESVLFQAIKSMEKDPTILQIVLSQKNCNDDRVVIINKQNMITSHTALHWAIINRNFFAVQALLGCEEIKVNLKNKMGNTPLHLAVDKDFVNVVWALAVRGDINFDATNNNGLKPESVNSGGSESRNSRNLLKKCREYIAKHPDSKYLQVSDIRPIREVMTSQEVNLPEVKTSENTKIWVQLSNVTATNISIAGGNVNNFQGDQHVYQNGTVAKQPQMTSSTAQQRQKSTGTCAIQIEEEQPREQHVIGQQDTRENTLPSYEDVMRQQQPSTYEQSQSSERHQSMGSREKQPIERDQGVINASDCTTQNSDAQRIDLAGLRLTGL